MPPTNNGWNNQIASADSAITLNSGTNNVNVSTDAVATTVLLGTGAAAKTVTLGSTSTTSTTNLQSGSGGINIPAFTEGALITSSTGGVSTVTGTAGYVLTANAAGTAPSFQAAGGGGGVTSLVGDSGLPYSGAVVISGTTSNTGTIRFYNSAPNTVFLSVGDVNDNVIVGNAGSIPGGSGNSAFGHAPFLSNGGGGGVSGNLNTCFGYEPFNALTSGSHNACFGQQPLLFLTTGSYNMCASAYQGGVNYTGNESNNILLNCSTTTVTGESNVLRIGDGTGTGVQQLAKAFISGIFGKTVGVSGVPVVVDNADQLGTVVSSARFKENIQAMPSDFSSKILDLKPTTFNYIADQTKSPTWGLIAEEVQKVMPELVVNGADGLPIAVKYNDLPVLLLNELIKLKKEIADLKANR